MGVRDQPGGGACVWALNSGRLGENQVPNAYNCGRIQPDPALYILSLMPLVSSGLFTRCHPVAGLGRPTRKRRPGNDQDYCHKFSHETAKTQFFLSFFFFFIFKTGKSTHELRSLLGVVSSVVLETRVCG